MRSAERALEEVFKNSLAQLPAATTAHRTTTMRHRDDTGADGRAGRVKNSEPPTISGANQKKKAATAPNPFGPGSGAHRDTASTTTSNADREATLQQATTPRTRPDTSRSQTETGASSMTIGHAPPSFRYNHASQQANGDSGYGWGRGGYQVGESLLAGADEAPYKEVRVLKVDEDTNVMGPEQVIGDLVAFKLWVQKLP